MQIDPLDHEAAIRVTVFLGVLVAFALAEIAAPRRRREIPRLLRWSNNLALVVLDAALVRLAFPVLAVGLAVIARDRGWGLMNLIDLPVWAAIVIAVLLFDLVIYLQHVVFHAVPVLWRLHRMHHADPEIDVTTGIRFHPVEILLSMALKLAVVAVLGPPAVAVLIFEVLLNATSLFNHSNLKLPPRLDAVLRLFVVTPDMHRVHHSIRREETDSNYGFNLPWWDRLLGTYRAAPRDGHEGMTIGLTRFRSRRDLWLDRMLIQPLRGRARDKDTPPAL
ncbi:MAG: sterol desaturase family protein [Rhodobacter sp.]|nr:sterol desaturase family protein [Rhodobacter sp.]